MNVPQLEELILACKREDRRAQKKMYEWLYGKTLGIPMRYTQNVTEAEEVLNYAFLKVFKSLESYNPEKDFIKWVNGIVFHTTIDYVRKKIVHNNRNVLKANFNEADHTTLNEALDSLATEEIFRCIQQLPLMYRTVFCLYEIEGYRHIEIAQMLNISLGTSKWYLSKAKKLLKKILPIESLSAYQLK